MSDPGGRAAGGRAAGDPRLAWRYWRLRAGPFRLQSVSQRRVVWEPGTPVRAVCMADTHQAPDEGCACGVYGTSDLADLRKGALCLSPGPLVVGEVSLWGPIVSDDHGYRAAFGYPRRLWLATDSIAEAQRAAVLADLADYNVPVGQMPLSEAVGEASSMIMGFLAMSGPQPPADAS